MDCTSDNDDFSWDSDDAAAAVAAPFDGEAGPSQPSLISHYVSMGFPEEMVYKAIKENREGDTEAILETLLTYKAIENYPLQHEDSPINCSSASEDVNDDFSDVEAFGVEDYTEDFSEKDKKLLTLVEMGYKTDEASSAIDRCGDDASVLELADSIVAARMAEEPDCRTPASFVSSSDDDEAGGTCIVESHIGKKRARPKEETKYRGGGSKNRVFDEDMMCRIPKPNKNRVFDEDVVMCPIPKPMIGFGLPFERMRISHRKLPEPALGPPYFYYENVALAPKGVWDTISRFLYEITPEFVDSKYFCAAARKRGYIHNLPIEGRFPLEPIPPKTIHEALPMTKKWWPSWDMRTQLNCLQTCIASAKNTERIRSAVSECSGLSVPPISVREYVLKECSKWNLVWVGMHKVAPLEPDEIEAILGFPRDHTRGISRTERYRSLGNSFQVDTVAFHLSVLKEIFPEGIRVLSLFSGIGGAEVALHRLGIPLKVVVSVEISEINRNIVRCWWEQTGQTGTLIDLSDVQELTSERLDQLISRFGAFDLVIGGSPCNNLTGSNRHTRDGLDGKHSSLFYEYFRILEEVRGK